jgi:excisionase family DNA binding protein
MQTTVQAGYLDYSEAERYTHLNRVTLWRLVKSGDLKASKVERAVRFKVTDLDAFMSSRAA